LKAPDHTLASVAQLAEFDAIVDVRSPAEYADDHVPGAINLPVLNDEERIIVGTKYKQESPFAARKIGAALVARNIARHLEESLADYPKSWKPLVYCWRGGQRSGGFTHILREIGWSAMRLEGGYKVWRHHVLAELDSRPGAFQYRVIGGPTGCGKSRLLEAIAAKGGQILHLEALAAHKGSVLGDLPGVAQPSQKSFETAIHQVLTGLDPSRPVYIEAESRRIGRLRLPQAIFDAICAGRRLQIAASLEARVEFLLEDYAYLRDAATLQSLLERLRETRGREQIERWQAQAASGDFAHLVGELLVTHYDPLYARSARQTAMGGMTTPFAVDTLSPAGIAQLADRVLAAG